MRILQDGRSVLEKIIKKGCPFLFFSLYDRVMIWREFNEVVSYR